MNGTFLSSVVGDGVPSPGAVTLERWSDGLLVTLSAARPDPSTHEHTPAWTSYSDPTPMSGPGEIEASALWILVFNHTDESKRPFVCRIVDIVPIPNVSEACWAAFHISAR